MTLWLAGCFSSLPWANSHTCSGLNVGLEPSSELGRLRELGLAVIIQRCDRSSSEGEASSDGEGKSCKAS